MNKNNMKHLYKLATIVLLTGVVGIYTQCVPETTKIEAIEGSKSTAKTPVKDEGEILAALEVSAGVKNYEEIFITYQELTGLDTSLRMPAVVQNRQNISDRLNNAFNDLKVSLPVDNDMKSYLSGHQVAAVKLAASFCNEMVADVTLRPLIWTDANYNMVSNNAFSTAQRDDLSNKLMERFWGASASEADKDSSRIELSDLITELLKGEANNAQTTQRVAKSVCTAVLSSMHVLAK